MNTVLVAAEGLHWGRGRKQMVNAPPKEIVIQEELERRILHGLACEWDRASSELDLPVGQKLRRPLFGLKDLKGRWGYWSSENRQISLSRDLVMNHTWDAVREVLLHEMAHQLAEEVLGVSDEPSHGPGFKRACLLLRANPEASGKFMPLDERTLQNSTAPEDRLLARVKKLMALAQSKNRNEAEAAMAKAHEFIRKHNLEFFEKDERRHFFSVFIGKPALRHFREDYHLSNLLEEYYFVACIWIPTYVLEKGKMGNVLEISGTLQNVRMAAYVHEFVRRFIDSKWQRYNREKHLNRFRKTDFAVGIVEGFRSKLKLQAGTRRQPEGRLALVKLEDPQLQGYMHHKYPRLIRIRRGGFRIDDTVLNDGKSIGKDMVIHQAIEQKEKGKRLRIPQSVNSD